MPVSWRLLIEVLVYCLFTRFTILGAISLHALMMMIMMGIIMIMFNEDGDYNEDIDGNDDNEDEKDYE